MEFTAHIIPYTNKFSFLSFTLYLLEDTPVCLGGIMPPSVYHLCAVGLKSVKDSSHVNY